MQENLLLEYCVHIEGMAMQKYITPDEAKERLVLLLQKFNSICEENNLTYSLAYGTLIGAIRHKGFIPWDDDIDVIMPQDDYLKFINLDCFKVQTIDSDYVIYDRIYDNVLNVRYRYPFAKFVDNRTGADYKRTLDYCGVYIDLFPITGFPSDVGAQESVLKKMEKYHQYIDYANRKTHPSIRNLKETIKFVRQQIYDISAQKVRDKMYSLAFSFPLNESKKAGQILWDYYGRQTFDKRVFEKYINVEFEGHQFKALKYYDEVLTQLYGNWRVLPPVEKQIAHHEYRAYMK